MSGPHRRSLPSPRAVLLLLALLSASALACGQKEAPATPTTTSAAGPAMADIDVPTLLRAARAAAQQEPKRAASLYRAVYAKAPDTPGLRGELAAALMAAGDLSEARAMGEEALAHATDAAARGAILYNLGRVAEAQGRREDAIERYRASLSAQPSEVAKQRLEGLGAVP